MTTKTIKKSMIESTEQIDSQQQMGVHRIYTKGSTFESASLNESLLKNPNNPMLEMKAQVNFGKREDDVYEAVLSMHVVAKHEGNLLWQIQLHQAGLYTLKGFTEEQIKPILNGFCANQLYPYACAEISNMVTRGGFPPVYLAPM